MATKIAKTSNLKLKFDYGMDKDGKSIIKVKNLSDVKQDASDQDLYDVAQIFQSLSDNSLIMVQRVDNNILEA